LPLTRAMTFQWAMWLFDPCIPSNWNEFRVSRKWRSATFLITVQNPNGVQKGVKNITLNGNPVHGPIPPQEAGSCHEVLVTMGAPRVLCPDD
jgi:N,N'-diacetylchitobiose phosphorylase